TIMSYNTFGHMFRVTTFGESHGVAIGCVVDGCPPLIPLAVEDIQHDLDRRRPGQSRFTTQRQEADAVKILSGVMAHPESGVQVTTGTPIALVIENTDQRSKDYSDIKDKAAFFESYLDDVRKKGSSIGAVIEIVAEGVPAGLGAPIYAKLDADLAAAMMSINAVKGVEIGAGFGAAELSGEENADEMRMGNQGVSFLSNHAGGILGGVSTGQPVVARFAVKPTSSILSPRRTVDRSGVDTDITTKGRHDPCVGIRAVPV